MAFLLTIWQWEAVSEQEMYKTSKTFGCESNKIYERSFKNGRLKWSAFIPNM
jgi:hypothetical protein